MLRALRGDRKPSVLNALPRSRSDTGPSAGSSGSLPSGRSRTTTFDRARGRARRTNLLHWALRRPILMAAALLASLAFGAGAVEAQSPGLTLSPTALTVGEGESGTYTVVLDSQPTGTVRVTVFSGHGSATADTDPSKAGVQSRLTFTTTNWSTPQMVTVTGVDNDVDDLTNLTATVLHWPSGGGYGSGQNANLSVTLIDDDVKGLTLSPATLTVAEGGTGTYTVVLDSQPYQPVTVTVTSSNGNATVDTDPATTGDQSTLTFTAGNWDTAQTVAVTGLDDAIVNASDLTATVTNTPSGSDYGSGEAASVSVTVTDDDAKGLTLSSSTLTVAEGGTGTYTVALDSVPTGPVTVAVTSSNGNATVDTDPATAGDQSTLTFTTGNWSTPQTVTVTGIDDDIDNPSDLTAVVTNTPSGGGLDGGAAASLSVTVTDDDVKGLTLSSSTLTVDEGGIGTYTVVLDSEPTGSVTVTVASSGNATVDTDPATTGDQSTLTFTSANWSTPQTVTVTAANDAIDNPSDLTATVTNTPSGGGYGDDETASVSVTVTNDDMTGLTLSPATLTVAEGGSGTYRVALDSEPTGSVTVTVASSGNATVDTDPATTGDQSTLTFTSANWSTPQTVTVTGANDAIDNPSDLTATVTNTPSGGGYGSGEAASLSVTVTNDDAKGLTLAPSTLTVAEGGTGTYTVVLDSEPTGSLTVAVASNGNAAVDTDPATTGDQSTLTFTTANWSTPQTVTVTGADDVIDNPSDLTATVTNTPSGGGYGDDEAASVSVTVTDDDVKGLTLSSSTLTVAEGGTGTYTVVLDSEPTGSVTVTVASSGNATVDTDLVTTGDQSTLTFTTANWSTPQTVTVAGANDAIDNPSDLTAVVTNTPSGGGYGSGEAASVSVTVTDDDVKGLTLSPATLTVAEGGSGTYTVVLNTEPTGSVAVTVASSGNATVDTDLVTTGDQSKLTFTTANWSTPQTVTVTGANDAIDNPSDLTATLTNTPAGGGYGSGEAASLSVTMADDDVKGLTLSPAELTVGEGGTGTYTVALDSEPTGSVTVTVASSGNATVDTDPATTGDQSTLTFTTANWSTAQTVTVSGANDAIDNPSDLTATVTNTPSGGGYGSGEAVSLSVTVTDDDVKGLTFSPATLTIGEGESATYTVVLDSEPTESVTVTVVPIGTVTVDTDPATTGDQSTLTFTTANWSTPQTITVLGLDDDIDNPFDLTSIVMHRPSGGGYGADEAASVAVTVTDDDGKGLTLSPATLTVTEGGSGTYTVVLESVPTGPVTVTVVSSNANATADTDPATAGDQSTLTFTTANWSTPQTVTVSGANDAIDNPSDLTATVTNTPSGGGYGSGEAASVSVTVTDDDVKGVTLSPSTLTVAEGGTGTYTVVLDSEPTGPVTVAVASNGNAAVDTDPATTGDQSTLTFTTANWSTPQTVTVTGADDAIDNPSDLTAVVTNTPSGGGYGSGEAASLSVTVTDDDVKGLTLSSSTLTVAEGGTGIYTVALESEPTGEVTVTVASSGNATVDTDLATTGNQSTLTFTTANWSTPQTVTVTGADDAIDNPSDLAATVTNTPAGGGYGSGEAASLSVTMTDDDVKGLTLLPAELTVGEGESGTYTVVLDSEPTGEVTVTIASSSGNATVDTDTATTGAQSTLTFTAANWSAPQTVTVTGANDAIDNVSDLTATVTNTPSGGGYGSGEAADLSVTVTDDDAKGLTLSPSTLAVAEGGTGTYTVVLDSEPTGPVTVTVASSNDNATVDTDPAKTGSQSTLTFTTANWSTPQTVVVTGANDAIDNPSDLTATVTNTPSGGGYGSGEAADLSVTVTDDDVKGLTFSPLGLVMGEGESGTYTVVLDSEPTGTVTVTVAPTGDATVDTDPETTGDQSTLTFTTENWSTPQTVTVSTSDNDIDDPMHRTVMVTNTPSGGGYGGDDAAHLYVTLVDNDMKGLTLSPATLTVDEGGTGTYTVVLNSEPTETVTVTVTVTVVLGSENVTVDTDPATMGDQSTLTFTTGNWDTAQTVTVSGLDDVIDNPSNLTSKITNMPSGGGYGSFEVKNLYVTVRDNDVKGLTLSSATLTVDEGGSGTYTVVLNTEPTGPVKVTVTSSNPNATVDTDLETTGDQSTLTFTTGDWSTPQMVTVTGINDDIDNPSDLTTTVLNRPSGGGYTRSQSARVSVTVTDDDVKGLALSAATLTVGEGDSGTYTVVLDSEPTGEVTVTVSSSNGNAVVDTDLATTGDQSTLTFTSANWSTPQTVTVTGADDAIDNSSDLTATITNTPSGGGYGDDEAVSVSVAVTDDDGRGLTLSAATLTVTEGGTGTYTVALDSEPTGEVTVAVASSNGNTTVDTDPDTTGSQSMLTFTTANWSTPQTVAVTGVNDAIDNPSDLTATITNTPSGGGYGGGEAASLSVTVTDDDAKGVTLSSATLTVAEGGIGTYTVVLDSEPTGPVTVTVASSNANATVDADPNTTGSQSTLTFTTGNWSTAQTVAVSGLDDAIDNASDLTATITNTPSGGGYGDDEAASVSVTVTDDDAKGLTLSPATLTVSEGESGTYTVILDSEPTGPVTVTVASGNGNATVDTDPATTGTQSTLTFTSANWSTAQTVTVLGVDDAIDNASDLTAVVTNTPSGGGYGSGDAASLSVTVTNDDVKGVTLSPAMLTVDEGRSGTYTVVLDSEPTGEVIVAVASGNGNATVSPTSLTFTTGNWDKAQTVTVTGANDAIDNPSDLTATITNTPSGGGYGDDEAASVSVAVTDDDVKGLTLSPAALTVAEGGIGTYTVVLDSEPTGPVTVTVASSNANATVDADPNTTGSQSTLTFTTGNWSTAQTVAVSGLDDAIDNASDLTATITNTPSGGGYGDDEAASVSVTVTDDDAKGLTLSPATLTVSEGESGTYTVILDSEPTGPVTVTVASGNENATVDTDPATTGTQSTLTFTSANWSTAQTVTVLGLDDAIDNASDLTATITNTPSGGGYGDDETASVSVTVTDDDAKGVTLSSATLTVSEGESGTYTVVLDSEPTGPVTVTVASSNANTTVDTDPDTTGSQSTLTFTTGNWDKVQTVTVAGANDAIDNPSDLTATITNTPSGGGYGDDEAESVSVTVTDDDVKGLTLSPAALTVAEGETGVYTVVLDSEPTGEVTVTVSSSNGNATVDTDPETTGSQSTLTFTTGNWSTPRTVTVSGLDDAIDNPSDLTATVWNSPFGGGYDRDETASVSVTVTDDDVKGVTLSRATLTVAEGGSGIYTVVLDSEPTRSVTVTVASSANATVDTDPDTTGDQSTLTFTTENWSTPQTVAVTGADDAIDNASNLTATVTNTPSGGGYGDGETASVSVTVTNDDGKGLTLSPATLTVTEGGSGTYTVVLNSEPTGEVTVAVSSSNGNATVSPTSLTFTTGNWGRPQTITVTGANDAIDNPSDLTATVTNTPSGGGYGDDEAASVSVTVTDNDAKGLTLSPATLTVAEGGSGTYTVALNSEPTSSVTVTVSSSNGNATVDTDPDTTGDQSTLTFTTENWSTAQTVTVSSLDDDIDNASDLTATITNTPSGGGYGDDEGASLPVTVRNDDVKGVTLSTTRLTVGEGGSGTYTVALDSEPTGSVTMTVASGNGNATVSPTSLTFTTGNWSAPQTVTVTGLDDAIDNPSDLTATVTNTPSGGGYGNEEAASVSVTVTDDDVKGLTLSPATLTVAEGGSGTYTVVLDSEPTGSVTVTVTSSNGNATVDTDPETTGSQSTLTFTTGNWSTPQTVTVSGLDDAIDNPSDLTTTVWNRPSGGGYGRDQNANLSVTVTDDDVKGMTLSSNTLTVAEGGSGTYTVALDSEPTRSVTVTVESSANATVDTDPATTGDQSTLTFTTGNWSTPQTVTVTGANDAIDNASNLTAVVTNTPSGGGYGGDEAVSVSVTVTNDDGKGLTLSPAALTVTEGRSGTYTVVLNSEPTGEVTVAVSSSNGNATVDTDPTTMGDQSTLTFTIANWSTAQTVTVSGADDAIDNPSDLTATVTNTPSGGGYGDDEAASVSVTVTDNDAKGLTLSAATLTMVEGGTGTYTVILNSEPTGSVTVTVASSNGNATVDTDPDTTGSQSTLTFTTGNWSTAQTVTVTGADDAIDNASDLTATITNSPSGGGYGNEEAASLSLTVRNDDVKGLTLLPTRLTVGEGESGTYTVVLDSEPTGSVTVTVAVTSGNGNATVNPTSLTFTTENWSTAQTVTVTGANDAIDNPFDLAATVTNTPSGGGYGDDEAASVSVTVTDDDVKGLTLSAATLTVGEGGSGTYTVVLDSEPTGSVTVTVTSSNGNATVDTDPETTGDQSTLTFTTENWDTAQTVTVTGLDDAIDSASDLTATVWNRPFGGGYDRNQDASLSVTVTDDDVKGMTLSSTTLTVGEGGSGTYTVALDSEPTGLVTVTVASSANATVDTDPDRTGDQSTLTFTSENWSTPQTVTVTGADDAIDNASNLTATVTNTPSGGGYGDDEAASVSVTVTNDDGKGLTLSPATLTVGEGERGSYTVVLDSEPTGPVTVAVSSGNENATVSPTSLTFTTGNWARPQTITVTGANDAIDNPSDLTAVVTNTPSGGGYGGDEAASVSVTVADDDAKGLTLSPSALTVAEGGSGTYTVALDSEPTGSVTVAVSSSNGNATVDTDPATTGSQSTLTFTTENWSTAQTVTVSGLDDDIDNASDLTAVVTNTPSGGGYGNEEAASLPVTVTNDDVKGVTLSTTALTVAEGGSGTYTVVLDSEPTGSVTVAVASGNGNATVSPTSLTFTTGNWDKAQTVTVSGANDAIDNPSDLTATVTNTPSDGGYGDDEAQSVSVTVTDDDVKGMTLSAGTLTVDEGGSGTYTVVLDSEPTASVTVTVTSSNGNATVDTDPDMTGDQSTLTFTTGNWSTPQTVTVSGLNDAIDNPSDLTATVWNRPFGGGYDRNQDTSLSVTVTDDDVKGMTLSSTTLTVGEGGSGTYTVALDSEPTRSVTVTVSSSANATVDTDPATTGDQSTLTFTAGNWSTPQTVTVSGLDDDIDNASDLTATVTNTPSGGGYGDDDAASLSVTVTNDDVKGVTLSSGTLTVGEGERGTYTVVLDSEPTGPVTVAVSSGNGNATVSPASLTFTTRNWARAQTVTVTGADDAIDNVSDLTATVTNTPSGGGYGDGEAASVSVTVTDDDVKGVTLSPATLTVAEGGTGTYTVALNSEPTGSVTVTVASSNGNATVDTDPATTGDQSTLTFTAGNWSTAQTVTVSGLDDDIDNASNLTATISNTPSGGGYSSSDAANLSVTVRNDDVKGVTLSATRLTVGEGERDTYTVVLDSEPTGSVTVAVSSSNGNAAVNPASLTFTTGNWDKAQTVTVTGANDAIDNPSDLTATVTNTPSGGGYGGDEAESVSVTVTDDDVKGMTLSAATLTVGEGGSGTYTVVLDSEPTASVTVTVTSSNGNATVDTDPDMTGDQSTLTFTAENWSTPQTVLVTGLDDAIDNPSDLTATVWNSPYGGGYDRDETASVSVTVTDDDVKGVTLSRATLTVAEGGSGTYTVVLDSQPTRSATVTVSSSNGNATVDTDPDRTGDQSTLTFTTGNWSTPQTVTVSGLDDDIDNASDLTATVTNTPSGGGYGGDEAASLLVTVTNDDVKGVTLSPATLTVGEGERGTYTVVLDSEPTGEVTVAVSSSNGNATVSPTSLTFTTRNWARPQTITVTGANDAIDNPSDLTATVTNTPSGGGYGDGEAASVSVTVTDDDVKGLTLSPATLTVAEGGTGTYTVALNSEPTGSVTVTVASSNGNATVDTDPATTGDQPTLTFTTGNWSAPQTVTVTGLDDDIDNASNLTATISNAPSGGGYDRDDAASLSVTVRNDDVKGVTLSATRLTVDEGESGTYTVVLDSEPTGSVTVAVASSNGNAAVNSASLTFTAGNWSTPQTVEVTGVDDDIDNPSNRTATVTNMPSGGGYGDDEAESVSVTVTNDDVKGVTLSPAMLTVGEEESGTYTVVLNSEPTGPVTVTVASSDTGAATVSSESLTFTADNWSTPQTVTVSGASDEDASDEAATVWNTPSGGGYGRDQGANVLVTVTDDEMARLVLTPSAVTVNEESTETYTVQLSHVPTGPVTVTVASGDAGAATVSAESLSFTTENWSTAQTVTVTGVSDPNSADESLTISHTASGAGEYDGIAGTVTVAVKDDEMAGLVFSPSAVAVDEGSTATYMVRLSHVPTASVTVTASVLSGDAGAAAVDTDEGRDGNQSTLIFTTGDWDTAQTVTVYGVEDDDASDETLTISHSASGAPEYEGVAGAVTVTVADDEVGEKQVLEDIVASVASTTMSSMTKTIGLRFSSTPSTPRVTLAGRRVNLSPSDAADIAAADMRTSWNDERAFESTGVNREDLLRGTAFELALGGADDGGVSETAWTLWGRGDLLQFEGKSEGSDHDGSLKTGWLGADVRIEERWLAGLAVSRSIGEADYRSDASGGGTLETDLTSVYPYAELTTSGGAALRFIVGAGRGETRHTPSDRVVEKSDLDMRVASVGAYWPVASAEAFDLSLKGDAGIMRLETDGDTGASAIGGLTVGTWRVRGGLEAAHRGLPLSESGDTLSPFASLILRQDGGDGIAGTGLELEGGIRLASPGSRFGLDARAHWLSLHSEDGYGEWGASVEARMAPGADDRGLSWSVSPRQGTLVEDGSTLWRDDAFEDETSVAEDDAAMALNMRMGYGFGGKSIPGVLTPFAEWDIAGGESGHRRLEAGVAFDVNAPRAGALNMTLSGQRVETGADDPEARVGVELGLRF